MKQTFRIMFGGFLHALRRFWLEAIGGVFLAFGVLFSFAAVQEYRQYLNSPDRGITFLALEVFFSGLMLIFALDSFWRARKPRQ
jgi:hypothetical protein